MSIPLQFKLTQIGQAALWNSSNTGTALGLTHVQFGSGNRAPDGSETKLLNPQQSTAIAAGFSVTRTQIRMSAIFSGTQSYPIREIGLWAGDPTNSASKLVAYWSQANGDLAYKSAGVDFIFSHDMVLDNAAPAGSLTIQADNAQSAMLAMLSAHEAKTDPHPQYATDIDLTNHINATDPHTQYAQKSAIQTQTYSVCTTSGNAPAFTANLSPALTAYVTGLRVCIQFHAAASASTAATLNLHNLGAKALKQYDWRGNKVNALVVAGQRSDVEYDGTDFLLRDPLPGFVVPPGEVQFFALSSAPDGYLKANGAAVSRTLYAALFSAIGTTFGSQDSSTFNLPDLRGEFVRGWDDGRGVDVGRGLGGWQKSTKVAVMSGNAPLIENFFSSGLDSGFNVGNKVPPIAQGPGADDLERISLPTAQFYHLQGDFPTISYGITLYGTRPRNLALLACIKY